MVTNKSSLELTKSDGAATGDKMNYEHKGNANYLTHSELAQV